MRACQAVHKYVRPTQQSTLNEFKDTRKKCYYTLITLIYTTLPPSNFKIEISKFWITRMIIGQTGFSLSAINYPGDVQGLQEVQILGSVVVSNIYDSST